jgi:hypothetical protein
MGRLIGPLRRSTLILSSTKWCNTSNLECHSFVTWRPLSEGLFRCTLSQLFAQHSDFCPQVANFSRSILSGAGGGETQCKFVGSVVDGSDGYHPIRAC